MTENEHSLKEERRGRIFKRVLRYITINEGGGGNPSRKSQSFAYPAIANRTPPASTARFCLFRFQNRAAVLHFSGANLRSFK